MKGDTIKTISSKNKKDKFEPKKGANFHTWNMRGKDAEKLEGMILWWGSTRAPQVVPGDYKVTLSIDD